ncbi:MAG: preprotein translocase subunit SecE [Gammaproteobacteria bacterium]|nr:preprotein translocase subunit SecE [Gammaproteobacteria bacterium]
MVAKAEVRESRGDGVKLFLAAALLVAGVTGFYYFSEESQLFRVLGLLAVLAAAVAVVYQTAQGRGAWLFVQDARTEMHKVVWPTRQETVQTTLIVLVVVVLVAFFLWLLDMFLSWGYQLLTGSGG